MKIVVATGGFDPLHAGHVKYLQQARALGDMLIVGVNSDAWLTRKKGKPFLSWSDRSTLVSALKWVDQVVDFDDIDGSAIQLLHELKKRFPNEDIIFANGGDRTPANIPELVVSDVVFRFGVGGEDKVNSSSHLLAAWASNVTARSWGSYYTIDEGASHKVKRIVIEPDAALSYQRHSMRDEHWTVIRGELVVDLKDERGLFPRESTEYLRGGDSVTIPAGVWHHIKNGWQAQTIAIEVQLGRCLEDDIERK